MKTIRLLFFFNFILILLPLWKNIDYNLVETLSLELLNSVLLLVTFKKSLFNTKLNPLIFYTLFFWLYFCFSTIMIKYYGFSFLLFNLKSNLDIDVSYFSFVLFLSYLFTFLGYSLLSDRENKLNLYAVIKEKKNFYLYIVILFFFLIPLTLFRIYGFTTGILLSTTHDINLSNFGLRVFYICNSFHLLFFFYIFNCSLYFKKKFILVILIIIEFSYIFLSGNRREFISILLILYFLNSFYSFIRISRFKFILFSFTSVILLFTTTLYGYYLSYGSDMNFHEFFITISSLSKDGNFGNNIFLWITIGPIIQSYNGLIFFIQSFDFFKQFGPQDFFSFKYLINNFINASDPHLVRDILNNYGNFITIAKYDETPLTLLLPSDIIISKGSVVVLFLISFIIGLIMKFFYNRLHNTSSYLYVIFYISYFLAFSLGFLYSPISGDTVLPLKTLFIILILRSITKFIFKSKIF